jgi:hypothetical protein
MSTLIAILLAGVAQSTPASPARPAVDACALLSERQIRTVQGVPLRDRKPSAEEAGGMQFDQCFYGTSDFTHSVSLTVIRGATPAATRQYWKKTFEKEEAPEDSVRRASKAEREKEGEARRIRGTGDEAVWTGDARAGTLYVLSGPVVLRISVGGVTNEKERIARSKALARTGLQRLKEPDSQSSMELRRRTLRVPLTQDRHRSASEHAAPAADDPPAAARTARHR